MAKIVMFTGGCNTGVTFCSKYVAKIISKTGKEVAILDATKKKGMYYSLNTGEDDAFHNSIAEVIKGENSSLAVGDTLDIFTANKDISFSKECYLNALQSINALKYDLIVVDTDFEVALHLLKNVEEIEMYVVQDLVRNSAENTRDKLLKHVSLLKGVSFNIIYNKMHKGKTSITIVEKIYGQLGEEELSINFPEIFKKAKEYVIPLDLENYIIDGNNILDGIIETKFLTKDLKKSLFNIASAVTTIKSKMKNVV